MYVEGFYCPFCFLVVKVEIQNFNQATENAFEYLTPVGEMKPDVIQSANHWVELYLVRPFVFFSRADIILQLKRLFEEM